MLCPPRYGISPNPCPSLRCHLSLDRNLLVPLRSYRVTTPPPPSASAPTTTILPVISVHHFCIPDATISRTPPAIVVIQHKLLRHRPLCSTCLAHRPHHPCLHSEPITATRVISFPAYHSEPRYRSISINRVPSADPRPPAMQPLRSHARSCDHRRRHAPPCSPQRTACVHERLLRSQYVHSPYCRQPGHRHHRRYLGSDHPHRPPARRSPRHDRRSSPHTVIKSTALTLLRASSSSLLSASTSQSCFRSRHRPWHDHQRPRRHLPSSPWALACPMATPHVSRPLPAQRPAEITAISQSLPRASTCHRQPRHHRSHGRPRRPDICVLAFHATLPSPPGRLRFGSLAVAQPALNLHHQPRQPPATGAARIHPRSTRSWPPGTLTATGWPLGQQQQHQVAEPAMLQLFGRLGHCSARAETPNNA